MFPNTNPLIVKVKADSDAMAAPAVVMITEVAVVAPQVAVKPATLLPPAETTGVTDGKKKPEGYVSVMVPPTGTGFNAVNPIVTGTAVFPAFRSLAAIEKTKFML